MIKDKYCSKCRKLTNIYYIKSSLRNGIYSFYCKPCGTKEIKEKYQLV